MCTGFDCRALGLLIALLFLAGCETVKTADKPVLVEVEVVKPCIDAIPPEPDYETKHLQPDDPIGVVGQAYRIERQQRQQYTRELLAEMQGCLPTE